MNKPLLIGISARIHHPVGPVLDLGGIYAKTLHYLEQSVAHWVLGKGVLAVMIPAIESAGLLRRGEIGLVDYAAHLDGLVLQGGADIAPESYGETPLDPAWAGDRVRDRYEIELFNAFVEAGKPVIGICRGCQLINVALGGSLLQDISTQRPEARHHVDADLYDQNLHEIEIEPGSRLAEIYAGFTRARVNSIHHQAIDRLGSDVMVEARSTEDGVVEAIRVRGSSFVAGVQWHPEFHAQNEKLLSGEPLMHAYLAEAAAVKAARAAA